MRLSTKLYFGTIVFLSLIAITAYLTSPEYIETGLKWLTFETSYLNSSYTENQLITVNLTFYNNHPFSVSIIPPNTISCNIFPENYTGSMMTAVKRSELKNQTYIIKPYSRLRIGDVKLYPLANYRYQKIIITYGRFYKEINVEITPP